MMKMRVRVTEDKDEGDDDRDKDDEDDDDDNDEEYEEKFPRGFIKSVKWLLRIGEGQKAGRFFKENLCRIIWLGNKGNVPTTKIHPNI